MNSSPGWKKVIIKPHINYRMKNIELTYNSISGKYEISWKWSDNKFELNVTIPNGCDAEIILPNNETHETYSVKGGNYFYECQLNNNTFFNDTSIIEVIKNDNMFLKEFLLLIFLLNVKMFLYLIINRKIGKKY